MAFHPPDRSVEGQSLAQLAQSKGVPVDKLIDTILTAKNAAMAEAVGGGRDQLKPAEQAVHPTWVHPPEDPVHGHHEAEAELPGLEVHLRQRTCDAGEVRLQRRRYLALQDFQVLRLHVARHHLPAALETA